MRNASANRVQMLARRSLTTDPSARAREAFDLEEVSPRASQGLGFLEADRQIVLGIEGRVEPLTFGKLWAAREKLPAAVRSIPWAKSCSARSLSSAVCACAGLDRAAIPKAKHVAKSP